LEKEGENVRFRCVFSTEKIPLCYHMMFVSMIKESLKAEDKDYLNKLYYFRDKKNKKIKKLYFFCLSEGL
jgi:CRISPR-associated endoribonuclease Cas6